ncbi:hypothetical protein ASD54_12535 [Rhizobium sp. Root149]|uniref:hypothetical protein n=1 Tax=Rhizobium sp. Root149 TaxID=1736473 RepID=UPI000715C89B|nr:hypothetical protein [Rhizobium sp. Root149]KQZ49757.1 hypothetical protein ASD54_12535 [Rhizobium sp. Root149]
MTASTPDSLIGNLLDRWEMTPNDLKQEMREHGCGKQLDELLRHVDNPSPQTLSVGLIEAASNVIASASDTYKKRNGHLASFEDDSGEKCWIVPFDAFEGLRSAVEALATEGKDNG